MACFFLFGIVRDERRGRGAIGDRALLEVKQADQGPALPATRKPVPMFP